MKKKYTSIQIVNITLLFLFLLSAGCISDPLTQTPIVLDETSQAVPNPTRPDISGRIVYSSNVNTSTYPFVTQIFLKDLDTNTVTQLTHSGNNEMPVWSPDGTRIAYVSWSQEKSFDIYIMNDDGTQAEPLIASGASEAVPDWSPTGDKIVFQSNQGGPFQVYVIDLESHETTRLTDMPGGASFPRWSTDGRRIVFTALIGQPGRSQICIIDADGMNLKQMTIYDPYHFDGQPNWCPDDSCIIFTRYVNGVPRLMRLDLETREVMPLLNDFFSENLAETKLARSPLRKYLTFSVLKESYALNVETGELFSLGVIDRSLSVSLYP